MGRIAKTTSAAYIASAMTVRDMDPKEEGFCSVLALAHTTGVEVAVAYEAMRNAGRQRGKGATIWMMMQAADSLGFRMVAEYHVLENTIAQYPANHKTLKSVTTHHPRRFPKAWAGVTGIFHCKGHVAAVVNGEVADWTINHSKKVINFYRLYRK